MVQLPQLARPPVRMGKLEPHDRAHPLLAQTLWMAVRPARLLLHPSSALAQKALLPLVASLGADSVLPAQRPEVPSPQRPTAKLDSLVNRFILSPGHLSSH